MADQYQPYLEWLTSQHEAMIQWVSDWAKIGSHSHNVHGLRELAETLKRDAPSSLRQSIDEISLPPHDVINTFGQRETFELGPMLLFRKQRKAPRRALLGIHMDTVYREDQTRSEVALHADGTLHGPGVLDAKGGIAVMFKALEAFEKSPFADALDWDVFINPDEEIGSPGSGPFLNRWAPQYDLALVFEPALPGGDLVSSRLGSGNFSVLVHGVAAHAGREPSKGRNAINALAELVLALNRLHAPDTGVLVNVGRVHGGSADNVVPDFAVAHFNVRTATESAQASVLSEIDQLVEGFNRRDGIRMKLCPGVLKPPKMLDSRTERLLRGFQDCGRQLGLGFAYRESAGASDGNTLAAAGLPTLDSLGPRGAGIHSPDEHLETESLTERSRLVALFLMRLGSGELAWSETT